jgi:hypothetical protein
MFVRLPVESERSAGRQNDAPAGTESS